MKTSLAWHNLVHNKVKTSIAIAGVVFAIVLMFMQLGFLEAVKASATIFYDALDFDICIRSKDYLYFAESRNFPRARLLQAAGIEGVKSASPLLVANTGWRNGVTGERRSILTMGVDPDQPLFRRADLQGRVKQDLLRLDELLIDTKTRREYGPQNGTKFGAADIGTSATLMGEPLKIAGFYTLGAGLSSGGTAMIREPMLVQLLPYLPPGNISLGLLKVADSDAKSVARQMQSLLPTDVDVKTRDEIVRDELTYWVDETNYGLIFKTGVVLGLIVGIAIVYQVLSSDVAHMLPEYATLKAIGYGNRHLASVVLQQAVALAVIGYLVGLLLSQQLYLITAAGAQIPMRLTWQNALLVFVLSLVMCICSGLAALRTAFKADPADLF